MHNKLGTPGLMTPISGKTIDLQNLDSTDIDIKDIAWGLGRTLRYGGHIREDWTVAHHSVVMSYVVPEAHALEALLHDASEAYIGDIIWPVKALFPDISLFEGRLLLRIMDRFGVPVATNHKEGVDVYCPARCIKKSDKDLYEHESISMDRVGGKWHQYIEDGWLKAVSEERHEGWWFAPQYAFLQRFDDLTGSRHFQKDGAPQKFLQEAWFPADAKSTEDDSVPESGDE